jgi:cytochrome b561
VPWVFTQLGQRGAEGWITFLGFTCMQVLIFWVIDAILLTRAFLLDMSRDEPEWPKASLKAMHAELGLPDELATMWLSLRLVAGRTSWVGTFIWYPSLVIAGMFAATFTFEYGRYHFDINPVTLIASIGLLVVSVVVLREAAESWRSDVLRRLSHRRLSMLAAKPPNPDAVAQTQVLIDLVTQLRDGAFAPYSEQPLVRAVLLPALTFAATAGFPYLHVE